jgi:hypothetical protein
VKEIAMKRQLFLQWSVVASATLVGAMIAAQLGLFGQVYRLDVTKLSLVILAVFAAGTAWCGALVWRASRLAEYLSGKPKDHPVPSELRHIERGSGHGWFAIDLCVELGLLATVSGLVIMLYHGFSGFETGDPQTIALLIERLRSGMATAFITTLVGGLCAILLKVQFHLLSHAVERMKR